MPNRHPPESCSRAIGSPGIRNLSIHGRVARGGKPYCSGHRDGPARGIISGRTGSGFMASWARDIPSSETWAASGAHHVASGVGIAEVADAIRVQE